MVGQHGLRLAVHIVTSHFGKIVAKVCECLLRRGSLSLHELAVSTELPTSQVKNCLLVLIQHNCVQAFAVPRIVGFGGVAKVVTLYMVLFDNILHRMRFSKFLSIIDDDSNFGKRQNPDPKISSQRSQPVNLQNAPQKLNLCVSLLEGLLENGRLTFEQLVERAVSQPGHATLRDELCADFTKLVRAHYVEHCPKPEPFLEPASEDKTPARRRSKFVEEPTIEQQAIMAAALSDAERFSIILDIGENITQGASVTNSHHNVSVGEKRKCEVLDMDQEDHAAITLKDVLWRANFEKFAHCLKTKACVASVKSRLTSDAGIVLEAMIESTPEEKLKDKNSATSSIDNILERSRKKKGGAPMRIDDLRIVLDQLGCRLCTEEGGAAYTIDLKGIIESYQNDEVDTVVLKRYGEHACRIFRLLSKDDQTLETDRISDITFVEKKEVKGILYKLWKDEYLTMEKGTTLASGQRTYFFWKINKKSAIWWHHILEDMYHVALNMILKIDQIDAELQVQVSLSKERQALLRSRYIMESSLLKFDSALMLFNDFS